VSHHHGRTLATRKKPPLDEEDHLVQRLIEEEADAGKMLLVIGQRFGSDVRRQWVTDLSLSLSLPSSPTGGLTVGGNNITDQYGDTAVNVNQTLYDASS